MATTETVYLYFADSVAPYDPIETLYVRIFTSDDPPVFIAEAYTDSDGEVHFELDGDVEPVEYEVRYSKSGIPQSYRYINVESEVTNTFDFSVDTHQISSATDPKMCRINGRLITGNSQPCANSAVYFNSGAAHDRLVFTDATIGYDARVYTDDNGYFTVDLLRNAEIYVRHPADPYIDEKPCFVADASSMLLSDLIAPYATEVLLPSGAVFTFTTNEPDVTVPVDLLFSNGKQVDTYSYSGTQLYAVTLPETGVDGYSIDINSISFQMDTSLLGASVTITALNVFDREGVTMPSAVVTITKL